MAGYQRFVAYVYEYLKGKKGNNCGFVKVEVRGENCHMELHLQCPGLTPQAECKIYGFMRNSGLIDGYLLGICQTKTGAVECVIETNASNMNDSTIALKDMGGMIFKTENGAFFGTEWDDHPIRPENFREVTKKVVSEKMAEEEKQRTEVKILVTDESVSNEMETEHAKGDTSEVCSQSVVQTKRENNQKMEPEPSSEPDASQDVNIGEHYEPFADEEILECRKIHPRDLANFPCCTSSLRGNRFLMYGYYNFGHLLLGRKESGHYILGVPGGYDQQERFMANMFGFPYFKECREIELPNVKGGYWYRLINTANPHDRNRFL